MNWRMDNPFDDPSVVEAQRAAAQAPAQEDNPFADDIGKFLSIFKLYSWKI